MASLKSSYLPSRPIINWLLVSIRSDLKRLSKVSVKLRFCR